MSTQLLTIPAYGSIAGFAPAAARPPSWRDRAACRGVDVDVFFPANSDYREAAAYCAVCPVQRKCLLDLFVRVPEQA